MGDGSKIQWTDASWNPTRGCSRVSKGCDSCYAMGQASRFDYPAIRFSQNVMTGEMEGGRAAGPYEGLTTIRKGKVDWNGKVRLVPEMLDQPLRWTRPRRIFVNSMSDVFHESLSDETIAAIFGVMAACPRHVFQVLTKRARRMHDWFRWVDNGKINDAVREALGKDGIAVLPTQRHGMVPGGWPLGHVWIGVSCENQETADERIPLLLQTPAAIRFVSAEPLLGPIDLGPWLPDAGLRSRTNANWKQAPALSWLICGGESGPGARPFDLAWARRLRDQCHEAGVAYFLKQAGSAPVDSERLLGTFAPEDKRSIERARALGAQDNPPHLVVLRDRKGGDFAELPVDLRVREYPA